MTVCAQYDLGTLDNMTGVRSGARWGTVVRGEQSERPRGGSGERDWERRGAGGEVRGGRE